MSMEIGRRKIGLLVLKEHISLLGNLPGLLAEKYDLNYIYLTQSLKEQISSISNCSLIITPGEYIPQQVAPLIAAKDLKIPTLHIMDGILEWRNWFKRPFLDADLSPYPPPHPFLLPSICDYVACLGLNQKLMLDCYGNIKKTVLVGAPRLDVFLDKYLKVQSESNQSTEPKVLIATANTPAFSVNQQAVVSSFFSKLRDYLTGKKINVIWRLSGDLPKLLCVENSKKTIEEDIRDCAAVFTTPSTIWLEGMLAKRPTGILNPFNDPLMLQSPWIINSEYDFVLIQDAFVAHKGKMKLQDYYLSLNLLIGGKASQRIASFVDGIVERKIPDLDLSEFEKNYLTIGSLFPDFFRGFSVTDVVETEFDGFELLDRNEASFKINNLKKRVMQLEKMSPATLIE